MVTCCRLVEATSLNEILFASRSQMCLRGSSSGPESQSNVWIRCRLRCWPSRKWQAWSNYQPHLSWTLASSKAKAVVAEDFGIGLLFLSLVWGFSRTVTTLPKVSFLVYFWSSFSLLRWLSLQPNAFTFLWDKGRLHRGTSFRLSSSRSKGSTRGPANDFDPKEGIWAAGTPCSNLCHNPSISWDVWNPSSMNWNRGSGNSRIQHSQPMSLQSVLWLLLIYALPLW